MDTQEAYEFYLPDGTGVVLTVAEARALRGIERDSANAINVEDCADIDYRLEWLTRRVTGRLG